MTYDGSDWTDVEILVEFERRENEMATALAISIILAQAAHRNFRRAERALAKATENDTAARLHYVTASKQLDGRAEMILEAKSALTRIRDERDAYLRTPEATE